MPRIEMEVTQEVLDYLGDPMFLATILEREAKQAKELERLRNAAENLSLQRIETSNPGAVQRLLERKEAERAARANPAK